MDRLEEAYERAKLDSVDGSSNVTLVGLWETHVINSYKKPKNSMSLEKLLAKVSYNLDKYAAQVDAVPSKKHKDLKPRKKDISNQIVQLMQRADVYLELYKGGRVDKTKTMNAWQEVVGRVLGGANQQGSPATTGPTTHRQGLKRTNGLRLINTAISSDASRRLLANHHKSLARLAGESMRKLSNLSRQTSGEASSPLTEWKRQRSNALAVFSSTAVMVGRKRKSGEETGGCSRVP